MKFRILLLICLLVPYVHGSPESFTSKENKLTIEFNNDLVDYRIVQLSPEKGLEKKDFLLAKTTQNKIEIALDFLKGKPFFWRIGEHKNSKLNWKEWNPRSEAKCEKLLDTDESLDRVNMIFLGDNYNEKSLFDEHVELMIEELFSHDVFLNSREKINLFKVKSPGMDQGCVQGCAGIDRLICCDSKKIRANIENCAVKSNIEVIVLANEKFGGAGGEFAITSIHTKTFIHEFGHTFGNLRDEYIGSGLSADYPGLNCKNTLEEARSEWGDLENQDEEPYNVGYYQGCSYVLGNFRPTEDSLMKTLSANTFGAVNYRFFQKALDKFTGEKIKDKVLNIEIERDNNLWKIKKIDHVLASKEKSTVEDPNYRLTLDDGEIYNVDFSSEKKTIYEYFDNGKIFGVNRNEKINQFSLIVDNSKSISKLKSQARSGDLKIEITPLEECKPKCLLDLTGKFSFTNEEILKAIESS